jgi:hypothetical protein
MYEITMHIPQLVLFILLPGVSYQIAGDIRTKLKAVSKGTQQAAPMSFPNSDSKKKWSHLDFGNGE